MPEKYRLLNIIWQIDQPDTKLIAKTEGKKTELHIDEKAFLKELTEKVREVVNNHNELQDFTFDDFTQKNTNEDWKGFILNKNCIIFGKTFEKEKLEVSVHKNFAFSDCISQFNDYLKWLGGNRKDELINAHCEMVNSYSSVTAEELDQNMWYEQLEILYVLVSISEDGKIGADISCGDNFDEGHVLDIVLLEDKILYTSYNG